MPRSNEDPLSRPAPWQARRRTSAMARWFMARRYGRARRRILCSRRVLVSGRRAQAATEVGRRRAERAGERFREVALIGEAGLRRNRRERGAAGDFVARPLQPQRAHALADRDAVAPAEGAREVGRMDVDRGGDVGEAQLLGEAAGGQERKKGGE